MEIKKQYLEFLNLRKNRNSIWLLLAIINTFLVIFVSMFPERFLKTEAPQDMNSLADFVAISALIYLILISIFIYNFIKSISFFLNKHIFHKIIFIILSLVFTVERLYSFFELIRPCNDGNGTSQGICRMFLGLGISISVIAGTIGTIIIFLYSWFIYTKSKNEITISV